MSTDTDSVQMQAAVTANKLASAAVALAMAAILMAYMQLLLGSSMTSNALWKTNRAAIGVMAQHRRMIPSLRRVKVLCPQISLRLEDLAKAAYVGTPDHQTPGFLKRLSTERNFNWITVPSIHPSAQCVYLPCAAEKNCLYDPERGESVTLNMLPFFTRLRYRLWVHFQTYTFRERPRATWAQILEAFSISDGRSLLEGQLNADSIPATIDVPMQRIRLVDLGHLALALGCSSIELDVQNRFFRAVGPHCIITTEEIPTFGKVVRFEGDIHAVLNQSFGEHHRDGWRAALEHSTGHVPYEQASRAAFPPEYTDTLLSGTGEGRLFMAALDRVQKNCNELSTECKSFQRPSMTYPDRPYAALEVWQRNNSTLIPPVLATNMVAALPGAFIGFPHDKYLSDTAVWCSVEFHELLKLDSRFANDESLLHLCALPMGAFDFFHPEESVLFGKMTAHTWIFGGAQKIYDRLPAGVQSLLNTANPKESGTPKIRVIMLSMVQSLLLKYFPKSGVASTKKLHTNCNLATLWLQIVLIDVAIHLQLCDRNAQPRPAATLEARVAESRKILEKNMRVIRAIAQATKLEARQYRNSRKRKYKSALIYSGNNSTVHEFRHWDIQAALFQEGVFDYLGQDAALDACLRLSMLLRLRAVVYTVLLILGPDTSSLVKASGSQAQVPII